MSPISRFPSPVSPFQMKLGCPFVHETIVTPHCTMRCNRPKAIQRLRFDSPNYGLGRGDSTDWKVGMAPTCIGPARSNLLRTTKAQLLTKIGR